MTAPRATLAERLRPRTAGALARVAPVAASSWLWGTLVGLVAWQTAFSGFAPTAGIDGSWPLGVNLAASAGLDFGTDVAFTYGPLGYLSVPLLVDHELAQLGLLHSLATWIGLGVSFVFAARRSFPLPLAVGLALVAAWLADVPLVALALLWCAIAVGEDAHEAARRLLPWIGGAVGAMVLLTKVNEGLLILALCLIAALGMDRGRRLAYLAPLGGSFTAAFLVLWLASGQGLGELGEFARTSFEIASGYSTAQTLEAVTDPWRYQLGAAAMFALALGAAYAAGRESATSRRIALLLLVATAALFAWKTAFVRHELIRSIVVAMVPLTILLAVRWSVRWRLAAVVAFAAVGVAYFPLTGQSVGDVVRPAASVEGVVDVVRSVLDRDRLDRNVAASREGLARHYGLDERSLALLRDRDVHVYPYEMGLAWTYGLEWDPLPVFQSYVAYTPELDRLNAERLASPEGPERVLVHSPLVSFGYGADYFRSLEPSQRPELDRAGDTSVDGRYLGYEQPRTVVALLCHFAPLRTTLSYQVLGRVPDRCGHPRPLRSVAAESGEAVTVPRPPRRDDVIVAGVEGLAPEGTERLGATLYRAPPRRVTFEGERRFRLTPENTASDLLVRAPSAIDFPKPFRLAPNARTMSFSEDSGLLGSPGALLVSFFAMGVEPVHEPAR